MASMLRGFVVPLCCAAFACSGTVYEPPSDVPPVAVPGAAGSSKPDDRPAPAAASSGNPLFDASLADPAAQPYYRASLVKPAKTFVDDAGTSLTALALVDTSKVEAKGLTAEPATLGQKLGEGERAEAPLQGARQCVTGIAHGGLGVTELDIFLVDGPADAPVVIAEDTKSGPVAVVGGASGCVELAGSARLVVVVRKGSGLVVARLFRRATPGKEEKQETGNRQ